MNKIQILVVEDDAPVRNLITTTLKAHDYRFITAENGEDAVMEAASHNPDIIWIWDCRTLMVSRSSPVSVAGLTLQLLLSVREVKILTRSMLWMPVPMII